MSAALLLAAAALWFDDFGYADRDALVRGGWTLRQQAGHPGVPGARWSPEAISLVDDPQRRGNRLLRLTARTDGTPEGTEQAQLCHARKALHGTYAARVRFADEPQQGADGDPVIQTFYAVSPLRFDFDPEFSEIDWEYLANGGWGSDDTRLYAITWQTVRVEPWQAHNAAQEVRGSLKGWHTLVMQVADGRTDWFVDGRRIASHGGRNHPVVPMAPSFSLWFSPTGLLPRSEQPRVWVQEVDWVLYAAKQRLAPTTVNTTVARLRVRGVDRLDQVPAVDPPLPSLCNF